jgi:hypothetical protein
MALLVKTKNRADDSHTTSHNFKNQTQKSGLWQGIIHFGNFEFVILFFIFEFSIVFLDIYISK